MIQKGNRQQGSPYFLNENNSQKLERIPLIEKHFQENWLQKLIHENPQILPIDDIESGFAPLISLGREIQTSVGFIDNLYISPNGYLTIVETKLWRNPEAKREVVGQIIDYAKDLSNWSFSKLNERVKNSNNQNGIIELIKEYDFVEENEEQSIIDNVERNLKRGRFLLLIVGDGIRESVEEMVDYLSSSTQLHFTLGLVELQVYKNPNSEDFIIIPNLITRTREIIRAIIKIENAEKINAVVVESDFKEEKNETSRSTITEEDFFEQLSQNTDNETTEFTKFILEDTRKRGFYIDWNLGSFVVKYLDPNGSGLKISLYVVDRKGLFYLMQSGEQLKRLGIPNHIAFEFAEKTAKLLHGIEQHSKNLDTWNKYGKTKELKPIYPEFMKEVENYVEKINNESKKAIA